MSQKSTLAGHKESDPCLRDGHRGLIEGFSCRTAGPTFLDKELQAVARGLRLRDDKTIPAIAKRKYPINYVDLRMGNLAQAGYCISMNVYTAVIFAFVGCGALLTDLSAQQTDLQPPSASILSIDPQVVDVTNGAAGTTVRLRITDDVSGLSSGSLIYSFDDAGFKWFVDNDSLVEGLPTNGIYEVDLSIPAGSPPGVRKLAIQIVDQAGRWFSTDFESPTFTVVNNGPYDREKPTLHAVNIIPKVVDLTDGPSSVIIEFDVSDDFSGISSLFADPIAPVEDYNSPVRFIFQGVTEGSERKVLRTEFNLGPYTPAGEWFIYLDQFFDRVNRSSPYDFGAPAYRETFDPTFTVINPNEGAILVAEIDYTDDVSGIEDFEIRMTHEDGLLGYTLFDSWLDDDPIQIIEGDSLNGTARLVCQIPPFSPEGEYTLTYSIDDHLRRGMSLRGSSSSFPFPQVKTITILNSGPDDREGPRIVSLDLPESVDVTDTPQQIAVAIGYFDDTTGPTEVSFSMYSPSGDSIWHELSGEDLLIDNPELGTVNMVVTIPAFSEAGTWELRAVIYDGLERIEFMDIEDLESVGMRSTIEVENRQPPGYLWRESVGYPDDWRYLEWFGWLQDSETYPYVYHLEHGWIFSGGSNPESFHVYDSALQTWWWVNKDSYPYMYASGRLDGWYFYYAPYGRPGARWFHHLARGFDIKEPDL